MIESNETLLQFYASASWIWACAGALLIALEFLIWRVFGSAHKAVYWYNVTMIPLSMFVCGSYMMADYYGFGFFVSNVFCGSMWVAITFMKVNRLRQWKQLRKVRDELRFWKEKEKEFKDRLKKTLEG